MVARNEQKMNEKLQEVKQSAVPAYQSEFQCKAVVADFAKMTTMEPYFELVEQVKDLDIAMVYLNAGVAHPGLFEQLEPSQIQDQITLSALHPAYLTKALLSQLTKRDTMSAIVVTSSTGSVSPVAGYLSYSASKSFSNYLGRGLFWELKGKVDVLSWCPGYISTKMTNNKAVDSFTCTNTTDAIHAMYPDLGKQGHTHGHWKHKNTARQFDWLPEKTFANIAIKDATKQFNRNQKNQVAPQQ